MPNTTFIILTVIGWIVLGALIPTIRYLLKKFDSRLEVVESIVNKGGFMSLKEHSAICEKVTKENSEFFCKKLDEIFKLHKEWLEERLARLESDMKLYVKSQKSL